MLCIRQCIVQYFIMDIIGCRITWQADGNEAKSHICFLASLTCTDKHGEGKTIAMTQTALREALIPTVEWQNAVHVQSQ